MADLDLRAWAEHLWAVAHDGGVPLVQRLLPRLVAEVRSAPPQSMTEILLVAYARDDERFIECTPCAAKPGAPALCPSCLHNRALINRLIYARDRQQDQVKRCTGTLVHEPYAVCPVHD